MNLLSVSHFYESHGGGIERVAAQLCRQFARDGHRAVWAASSADAPPVGRVEALPLHCWNPTEASTGLPMPIPVPGAIRALARAIDASDAVIVHDALYVTSILAVLLAKARAKPVVLVQHIAGVPFANAALRHLMRLANICVTRPMLGTADILVFISNEVRRALVGERPRRNCLLLFNGVDPTIFSRRDAENRFEVRLAHGIPADGQVAIFVGRFVEKKGMSVLEAVARRRPELSLVLVGAGPIRPQNWDLPNVHVLGPQPQQTIAELYSASELFLLPSVGEGYPLVVQEAMACGLPVICGAESARADPGAARWLRGVEIDLKDPGLSALRCCAAIDAVLSEGPDLARMAVYAAETYSWPAMAKAIVASLLRPVEALHPTTGRRQEA